MKRNGYTSLKKFFLKFGTINIVCIFLYIFILIMAITLFGYHGPKNLSGTYFYADEFGITETIRLFMNNKVEYHRYNNGTEVDLSFTSTIVKWRSAIDKKYPEEFVNTNYVMSIYQIDFCRKDGGAYFQLLDTENGKLYSKPKTNQSVGEQKCYIKR